MMKLYRLIPWMKRKVCHLIKMVRPTQVILFYTLINEWFVAAKWLFEFMKSRLQVYETVLKILYASRLKSYKLPVAK